MNHRFDEAFQYHESTSIMKNPINKIDSNAHYTPGIEGYVFDGADGSQMAFWTYNESAKSQEHSHE